MRAPAPPGRPDETAGEGLRRGWQFVTLAGLSACVTARLLTPTEGAVQGETLWIVVFSAAVGVWWLAGAWRFGVHGLRLGLADAGVALLVGGHLLAAGLVLLWGGDRRAALNLMCEWVGVGWTWLLLRQAVSGRALQGLAGWISAVVCGLAVLGLVQHFGGQADLIREYDRVEQRRLELVRSGKPADPQGAKSWEESLARVQGELFQMGVPADDRGRLLFEQRLKASREPIGLFALTNTLAGVLLLALVLWGERCGVSAGRGRFRSWHWGPLVAAVVVVFCLVLTKSRTAYVGLIAAAGTGLAMWWPRRGGSGWSHRVVTGVGLGALGIVLVAVLAAATGGLDRLVLLESGKSVRYRVEYWRGTWGVLTESPGALLLGVGPGNFRQHYTAHKLPQASEEVFDPHNLVLDVWVNGGLLALAGLGLASLAAIRGHGASGSRDLHQRDPAEQRSAQQSLAAPARPSAMAESVDFGPLRPDFAWGSGGVLGGLLVVTMSGGLELERVMGVLLVAGVVAVLTAPVWRAWPISGGAWGAGLVGASVHLLGAGGIALPAMTQLLGLFLAGRVSDPGVVDPASAPDHRQERVVRVPPGAWLAGLGMGLALLVGVVLEGWIPVTGRAAAIAAGDDAYLRSGNERLAEQWWQEAVRRDRWSAEGLERLAATSFARWRRDPAGRVADFERGAELAVLAIARDPHDFNGPLRLGQTWLERAEIQSEPRAATIAVHYLTQAAELYPNDTRVMTALATGRDRAGDTSAARRAAERALELNDLSRRAGHVDRVLSAEQEKALQQILAAGRTERTDGIAN